MSHGAQAADIGAGLFGKLPARGDFVRVGLPRDFTDGWDSWWSKGLAETQSRAAENWVASWLEAPVWRFVLPPGLCGGLGVLGVWLPSVDKAGRYYPLTLAAVAPFDWTDRVVPMAALLDALEDAGRDALEHDLTQDVLAGRATAALASYFHSDSDMTTQAGRAVWWTDGGIRVAPRRETGDRLPEGDAFATLIDDAWAAVPQSIALNNAGTAGYPS
jgi:type VI secretion system protein ImpM